MSSARTAAVEILVALPAFHGVGEAAKAEAAQRVWAAQLGGLLAQLGAQDGWAAAQSSVKTSAESFTSHESARRSGCGAGAELVLWGRLDCNGGQKAESGCRLFSALTVVGPPLSGPDCHRSQPAGLRSVPDLDLPPVNDTALATLTPLIAAVSAHRHQRYSAAAALFTESAGALQTEPLHPQLQRLAASSYLLAGDSDRAQAALARSQAACDAADRGCRSTVTRTAGQFQLVLGDLPAAEKRFTEAREIFRGSGAVDEEAATLIDLGTVAEQQGDYTLALKHFSAAERLSAQTADPAGKASALLHRVSSYAAREDYEQAQQFLLEAQKYQRLAGDPQQEVALLRQLALVQQKGTARASALPTLDRARYLAAELRASHELVLVLLAIAAVEQDSADWASAERTLQTALASAERSGDIADELAVRNDWASLSLSRKLWARAAEQIDQSLERSRQYKHLLSEAKTLFLRGQLYTEQGDQAQALSALTQAAEAAQHCGAIGLVAQTLYLRGVIHQNRNQSGNALLDYEAAAALQRRLGQDRGEAAALEQAATVLQALNRSDEAVDHFVASGVSLARVAASLRPAAEFVTYRGFREALRTGHYGAAERALRGLQNLNVPELQLLHDRAQLLGQSDDPGAEQIYSRLLEQSRSLTPDLQEHFRLVVDSGRLRQRLRGTFGGCPGVVVVRRAILPESADALLHGDILLRLNGECIHSAGYLRPILESSRVDQGLALQILRRGILRTLTLPKDWLKVQVVPF